MVLLIDEIDKADLEFPNDLLYELDQMSFDVVETGDHFRARHRPIVMITSNSEKELPDAFLRRCLFHYIEFPDPEMMKRIARVHYPDLEAKLLSQVVARFYQVRERRDLKKRPSTSELLDWVRPSSPAASTSGSSPGASVPGRAPENRGRPRKRDALTGGGMFINLFRALRRQGIPVTFNEWLLLQDALEKNLADSSLTRFYHLARAIMVKTEGHFDRFDQAFLECFGHIESDDDLIARIAERLARLPPLELTEEEKRLVEELELEEVRGRFLDRLRNQDDEEHVGGNQAIGVKGRSPFGAWGYNPPGSASARVSAATGGRSRSRKSAASGTTGTTWRSTPGPSKTCSVTCARWSGRGRRTPWMWTAPCRPPAATPGNSSSSGSGSGASGSSSCS